MTTSPPHQAVGSKVKHLPRRTWPEVLMDVIGGSYVTYHKERGPEGKSINITLPSPDRKLQPYDLDRDEDMESWLSEMDDKQVEAGRMIYYHKWAFETGSASDMRLWKGFEEEKRLRYDIWNTVQSAVTAAAALGVSNRGSGPAK